MLLKPNMVIAGQECPDTASVDDAAVATSRCLRRHVPAAVPGIVFLSGGQDGRLATTHLNAINWLPRIETVDISFSEGRALQDQSPDAGHGNDENLAAGQRALYHRAHRNGAACPGAYTNKLEETPFAVRGAPDRREWRDD
jgi:fructose-bisphosphate aldolase, class I